MNERRFEIAQDTVESPYRRGEYDTVEVNVQESPARLLYARRKIGPAQLRADSKYRRLWETARLGGGKLAVDPSNEPVQVSGVRDPVNDYMLDADAELARISRALGVIDAAIVEAVSGKGIAIIEFARGYFGTQQPDKHQQRYISHRFRDALKELARHFNLSS